MGGSKIGARVSTKAGVSTHGQGKAPDCLYRYYTPSVDMGCLLLQGVVSPTARGGVPAQGPISCTPSPMSLDEGPHLLQQGVHHVRLHGILIPVYHLRGQGPCSLRRAYPV